MKRLKHNFKKGMAFVLSLAMVAGLVPAMSGGANKVQAAPGSGTELSVSAYATKEQLMTAFTRIQMVMLRLSASWSLVKTAVEQHRNGTSLEKILVYQWMIIPSSLPQAR